MPNYLNRKTALAQAGKAGYKSSQVIVSAIDVAGATRYVWEPAAGEKSSRGVTSPLPEGEVKENPPELGPPAFAEKTLIRTAEWPYAKAVGPVTLDLNKPASEQAPETQAVLADLAAKYAAEPRQLTGPPRSSAAGLIDAAIAAAKADATTQEDPMTITLTVPAGAASQTRAYDAAKAAARALATTIVFRFGNAPDAEVSPPRKAAAAAPSGDKKPLPTSGRLTEPGAKDRIAIDLGRRPEGVNAKDLATATGWKDPAPTQEFARLAARWGFDGYEAIPDSKPKAFRLIGTPSYEKTA